MAITYILEMLNKLKESTLLISLLKFVILNLRTMFLEPILLFFLFIQFFLAEYVLILNKSNVNLIMISWFFFHYVYKFHSLVLLEIIILYIKLYSELCE